MVKDSVYGLELRYSSYKSCLAMRRISGGFPEITMLNQISIPYAKYKSSLPTIELSSTPCFFKVMTKMLPRSAADPTAYTPTAPTEPTTYTHPRSSQHH